MLNPLIFTKAATLRELLTQNKEHLNFLMYLTIEVA